MQSAQFACAHQMVFIIRFNPVRAVKVFVRQIQKSLFPSRYTWMNKIKAFLEDLYLIKSSTFVDWVKIHVIWHLVQIDSGAKSVD